MEKNYFRNQITSIRFVLIAFTVLFFTTAANAQVYKEFQQRTSQYSTSKKIYNIKGDFTMIGNTNLSLYIYGDNTNNSNNYMQFVDEDGDSSTENSSAAVLEFSNENGANPDCSSIIYAGLYWSGRTDTSEKTSNKRKIKVKGPNNSTYQTFTANPNDILFPGPSNMYAAYAEVTDLVRNNGTGEYWVADMELTEGNGGVTGYYGGWGMIVIYENSQMDWRDVTIFDGYAHVEGNVVANYELPVSGFNTAQSGPVNMKLGIMAGEGDVGISGDYFQIKKNSDNTWLGLSHEQNSTNNFFNSSIENDGISRTPNYSNNTGIDISMFNIPNNGNSAIDNNQTSTTFRYGSTQDTYSIFSIAMSVDAYIPEIEGVSSLTAINGSIAGNPPYNAEPGDELSYKIELKNKGTENVEDVKVVIPVPYNADYLTNSLSTNFYFSPTPQNYNVYFDPTLGATGSIVWEIDELPLATNTNDILADLTIKFGVTRDCTILSNVCPGFDLIRFNGNISGRGAITGTTFENKDLIQGYETEGTCQGQPITSPFEVAIDATNFRAENCGNSDEERKFIYCNREDPIKISEINSGFPNGTRFFNESPVTSNSTEYTTNNPIPNNSGSTEYYAVIPGTQNCAIPFTIEITTIASVPETESITYCLNDEADSLTAVASDPDFNLYYYTSEADTTPEIQITPSTSQAGEITYYVAEGESASCISPNKAPIKVSVIGEPEITAPQNQTIQTCDNDFLDNAIPGLSNEFTTIAQQVFTDLGGSISFTEDIESISYKDILQQQSPAVYKRIFRITYECGKIYVQQSLTLENIKTQLEPFYTKEDPTCKNENGVLTITNFNENYDYELKSDAGDIALSNAATSIVPGVYTLSVTLNDCVFTTNTFEILPAPAIPGTPEITTVVQPNCKDITGTISVTTEQGISYTLLDENQNTLNNVIANGTFSGLTDGKYFVEASNEDCEAVSEALVITKNLGTPNQPQVSVSQQPSCDDTTGTISVTTEQGISYTLLDENQNPLNNVIADGTFSDLTDGKYFVEATNGDCEAVSEALVIIKNLGTPGQPQANVSQQPSCEDTTGTISVTTEQGISYTLLDENQNPLNNVIANGTFSGLTDGKYFVQASNGDCEAVSEELEIIKNEGGPGSPVAEVSQQPTCEDTTGTISVNTEAGISYTLLDENQNPLNNSIENGEFSDLAAATYFVQASNGDCEAISEALVIIKNEGAPIAPITTSITNTTCSLNNGIIEFEPTEGLTFILKDSEQNEYSHKNGSFTDLASGVYYLVAKNNNCETEIEVSVEADQDKEAPEITSCPTDLINVTVDEGTCTASQLSFGDLIAKDNCDSELSITNNAPELFSLGETIVIWTVTDAAGNESTCTQTVTVIDNQVPVIYDVEAIDTTANACGAMIEITPPQANDNCSVGNVIGTRDDNQTLDAEYQVGTTTITWTVTDENGNQAEPVIQTVTVTENQAPVIAEVESINRTADANTCGAMLEIIAPQANDNCSVGMATGTRDDNQALDAEYPVGTTTITWTVTDENGNQAEPVIQTVTVTDNQAPVINDVEAIDTTADANACGAMIEITAPEATDNCSIGNLNGTRDDNQALDAEYPVGTTTITWTVIDENGNEAESVIQTVTVTDNQAPVIANVESINTSADANTCGAILEITAPQATDNCSVGNVNGTRDDNQALDAEYPVGTTTITWTVNDANGNEAEPVMQTVTVTDNQAPSIECPENMIFSTETGVDFATVNFENPLATDNCEVTVEQTGGSTSGSQFPIGTTTITFTATDDSGNTTECSFDIIIEDTEDPTLECPSDIVRSTDGGICGAIVEFETPEGFDNSGNVTVEQSAGLSSGEVFPVGTTTITFTTSDAAGNTASCSFEISVVDDKAPVIEDKNDITVNTDPDICGAIIDYDIPSATDDCGLESITLTEGLAPGSEFSLGETILTYTAIDVNGNSVNSSFIVTVIDNQAPVIACPEDIQLNVEFGTETVVVNYATISATDNCSETSIELIEGYASGEEFPVGETIVTYEVTDASGNTASCSFTVIVEEEPEETPAAPDAPQVEVIQPDCVTPIGVILINTEDGLTYSIDRGNYETVDEFTELEPGTYSITARDAFDQISEPTVVTIEEPVANEIETSTISLCTEDITFDLFELLEGDYDTSGVWVDSEDTGALNQGIIDPAMLPVDTYTFEYQLNNGICNSTTEVTVSINDDCIVLPCSLEDIQSSISKAVTPNGDTHNDYFSIDFASECGFTYDVKIFNRWGNKIYEAINYQNDWDGYSTNSVTSSNQLPSGTYFYILEIRNSGFAPIQGYIYLGTK
ncbi:HYR domain-containing protein [Salegentibacter salegens]|uniref:Gliding motility-associated C-terminal domain-containing protein n=1 Tax=Salegentibacter salegens TaxID=143223 RepID=A0A1M7JJW3_9FLAO|nr:HYR domain-containing protein [Salegentibacter salegens]PRX51834.1 gliding motility-associated-like protein [Salegentibacter salegens]SHM53399.1 gliding motility-associated C-terminal domain-containing protein [Salegentibacter salegens]